MQAQENQLIVADPNVQLPNQHDAVAAPIDLMSDYWTPETIGEKKRVFFLKIDISTVRDENSGEEFELPCAYFLEQNADGELVQIRNGSKRLVAVLETSNVQPWSALEIEYAGKRKNKTNQFKSDWWHVRPLKNA